MHGSAQSPNGAGKILAGQQQVVAGMLRAKLAFQGRTTSAWWCNSAIMMMVAPENDAGPLRSPESSPHLKVEALRGPELLYFVSA